MARTHALAVPLALLLLTGPSGPARADGAPSAEPDAKAVLATLPFEPVQSNRQIVIDLAPKGNARQLRFQVDTGATTSFVSPRLARSMSVKVSRTKADAYRRQTILGDDVQFYVDTRRSDTSSGSGLEFGLLGADFFSRYVLELDFPRGQVRFLDPDRYQVPAATNADGEAVLSLTIVSGRPSVRASVDGHAVDLLVDTGFEAGLVLSGEIARSAGIVFAPEPGQSIIGVVGRVESHAGEAARFEIGPIRFEHLPVSVLPNGFFNLGFPGDSLIGYDLLSQFLVRIDYPHQRLLLRRQASAATPSVEPNPKDPDGAVNAADATRVIAVVAPPPPMPPPIPQQPEDAYAARAPRDASGRQIWLEWKQPTAGTRLAGPVGFVSVEGWAGVGDPIRHDVVLVIDVSGSTAVASGADVDGDGHTGKARKRIDPVHSFNPRHLSSDAGDTVLAAELAAAHRLVELLDPDRTRIGIVAFSDAARILAPLGSPRERIEQVLDDLDDAWGSGATNLADAIARGAEVLLIEADPIPRRKTLIILSDGYPSTPGTGNTPAIEAYKEAVWAGRDGVRIDSFGLGLRPQIDPEKDVYVLVSKVSHGRYVPLPQPAAVVEELPRIDLAEVASIEIANATSGSSGRAVRVLPDGSFDGVVLLADGENRIRVTAHDAAGASHGDERVVTYERRAARDAAEEKRFDAQITELRNKLKQRRVETELLAEIQAARAQQRELELHAEESPPQP